MGAIDSGSRKATMMIGGLVRESRLMMMYVLKDLQQGKTKPSKPATVYRRIALMYITASIPSAREMTKSNVP
jgi:hypothetical protein